MTKQIKFYHSYSSEYSIGRTIKGTVFFKVIIVKGQTETVTILVFNICIDVDVNRNFPTGFADF